ncbi:MAG: hypothetical protein ACJ74Y_17240 [Bryobacteraceae bacterium]
MPNRVNLRAAFRAGLPNAARLQELQRLENLFELPSDQTRAAFQKEVDAAPARYLYQKLLVLNFALQRDAGIVQGSDLNLQLQRLMEEVQQGQASGTRSEAAKRLSILWEAAGQLIRKDPSVTQAPTSADIEKTKLMGQALTVFAQLQETEAQTGPGTTSEKSISQLQRVLDEAKALLATANTGNQALPYVYYMTGSTARMLAGCYAIFGRHQEALNMYAAAAECFQDAGEASQAGDCKDRATDLQRKLAGDLDALAAAALSRLDALTPDGDPLEAVRSLMKLVDVASSAGDTFEAQQNARKAADLLDNLGYPNPLDRDLDEAVDRRVGQAAQMFQGVPLLGRLSQIGTWFDAIAGAEFAVAVVKNRVESDRIQAMQNKLHNVVANFAREARAAEAEQKIAMLRYFPDSTEKKKTEEKEEHGDGFQKFLDECTAIDESLAHIRESCNQRAGTGDGMEDLLAQLHSLQEQADQLNSPEYEAKTRLEEVYVLGHLGRATDMIPIAQEARRRLLTGRPDSLGSFSQSHQRYLYLDSRVRELQARMMSGDLEGGLGIAEATIQDFETERYRVQMIFARQRC